MLAFGNQLGTTAEVKLAGMDELSFLQLTTQLPPDVFLSSLELPSQQTFGVMQLDLTLAFPTLDLMLGGTGANHPVSRGLTEIEIALMDDITRLIASELEDAWQPVEISVAPGTHQKISDLRRLLPPDERVLALRFLVKINQSEGRLNVFVPIGTAAAMLRKLSTISITPARNAVPTAGQKIQERLLDCLCSMELSLVDIKVSVHDVLSLQPGKLVDLGVPISAPATVSLEGHPWFEASPVRAGSFRGAKLAHPVRKRLGN
jgi:flagellar motor switch protein FliM